MVDYWVVVMGIRMDNLTVVEMVEPLVVLKERQQAARMARNVVVATGSMKESATVDC